MLTHAFTLLRYDGEQSSDSSSSDSEVAHADSFLALSLYAVILHTVFISCLFFASPSARGLLSLHILYSALSAHRFLYITHSLRSLSFSNNIELFFLQGEPEEQFVAPAGVAIR